MSPAGVARRVVSWSLVRLMLALFALLVAAGLLYRAAKMDRIVPPAWNRAGGGADRDGG